MLYICDLAVGARSSFLSPNCLSLSSVLPAAHEASPPSPSVYSHIHSVWNSRSLVTTLSLRPQDAHTVWPRRGRLKYTQRANTRGISPFSFHSGEWNAIRRRWVTMPAPPLRCKNKRSAEKAERTPPCPSALISSEHFSPCVCVCVCVREFWGL